MDFIKQAEALLEKYAGDRDGSCSEDVGYLMGLQDGAEAMLNALGFCISYEGKRVKIKSPDPSPPLA